MDLTSRHVVASVARRAPRRPLVVLIAAFLLLASTYSVANPLFESNDEYMHFYTAHHLAEGRGFAWPDPTKPWFQEAVQPPLYYLVTAALIAPLDTSDAETLLWNNQFGGDGLPDAFGNKNRTIHTAREAWPYRGSVLAVHVGRGFSVLLGALTVALIYAVVRVLLPHAPRIALAAAALTAFTPQFLFLSASVSNDNVTNATAALAAWVLLAGLRGPRSRGWPVPLGVALGLLGLSKVSGLLFWPLAGLAVLVVGWRRGELPRAARELVVTFALAAAIAGWWYARNRLLYGDPTGVSSIVALVDQQPSTGGLADLRAALRGLRYSYWGMFGWFNVLSPTWLYRAMDYLVVLAVLGLPLALAPRLYGGRAVLVRRADLPWLLVPAAWLTIVVLALLGYDRMLPALQGRLLMPASWALNLFLVLGWAGLVLACARGLAGAGRRIRWLVPRLVAAAPLGLLAAWAVAAPFAIIAPAYAWPRRVTPAQVPEALRRAPVEHGPYIRFLGGGPARDTVRPAETLQTTAFWETLAPMAENYTAFVRALGLDGRSVASVNSWPGRGGYPTQLWQPGEVVVDVQQMTVPQAAEAVAPALLTLDAGFFLYPGNTLLEGRAADGSLARSLLGQVRLLPSRPPVFEPAVRLEAQFGEAVRLLGYTLAPGGAVQPGQRLAVTLYWEATGPVREDWTVFVHLRPKGGGRQAGGDGPPRGGAWPTSAWEPGYAVEDAHAIDVPGDMPRGPAEVWVGLYRADGARLPVSGTEARTADDALYLQDVLLQP